MQKLLHYMRRFVEIFKIRSNLIIDRERMLGNFDLKPSGCRTDLNKEEVSRRHILDREGRELTFLDVGARDGELTYLLGIRGNFEFDPGFYQKNLSEFQAKYSYFGMDLSPSKDTKVISGDACDPHFVEKHERLREHFDVIYSNNVFEHFERPWVAASNLAQLLKPGGIIITIVPFSQRYHESPGDYFRYTHKGVEALFASAGDFEVLESGYDILARRINWQGLGETNDIVPVDNFGAWRETWFTVSVLRKR
jgi:SAM-dependent methyltransferase